MGKCISRKKTFIPALPSAFPDPRFPAMSTFDLGLRCTLSLRGPDAVRYLNGQVTQDVRNLLTHPQQALAACVTDAKGKLQAYVTLYLIELSAPEIRIEAPYALRDLLMARLDRYLIADDAVLDDISDQYRLVHHIGSNNESTGFSFSRLGVPGIDQWLPANQEVTGEILSNQQAEAIRIAQAVPAWGAELTEGMLPPEAGIETSAISYQKGCYIGQEVISRIKTAGKLNRKLTHFTLTDTMPVGATLLLEGQESGTLTSVAAPFALGYLGKKYFGQAVFDLRLPNGKVFEAAAKVIAAPSTN
jgi:folate-binding protein YgfZ